MPAYCCDSWGHGQAMLSCLLGISHPLPFLLQPQIFSPTSCYCFMPLSLLIGCTYFKIVCFCFDKSCPRTSRGKDGWLVSFSLLPYGLGLGRYKGWKWGLLPALCHLEPFRGIPNDIPVLSMQTESPMTADLAQKGSRPGLASTPP